MANKKGMPPMATDANDMLIKCKHRIKYVKWRLTASFLIVQEFRLGIYDPEATALFHQNSSDVLLQKDHRSKSAAQRYHSHIFTNGTSCDLTSEPRETEVRFICSDTGNNMISSITEVSTCKYVLIFHTPILCKHPLFQEEKPRFLAIECEEMPPSAEVVDDDAVGGLPPSENVDEQ